MYQASLVLLACACALVSAWDIRYDAFSEVEWVRRAHELDGCPAEAGAGAARVRWWAEDGVLLWRPGAGSLGCSVAMRLSAGDGSSDWVLGERAFSFVVPDTDGDACVAIIREAGSPADEHGVSRVRSLTVDGEVADWPLVSGADPVRWINGTGVDAATVVSDALVVAMRDGVVRRLHFDGRWAAVFNATEWLENNASKEAAMGVAAAGGNVPVVLSIADSEVGLFVVLRAGVLLHHTGKEDGEGEVLSVHRLWGDPGGVENGQAVPHASVRIDRKTLRAFISIRVPPSDGLIIGQIQKSGHLNDMFNVTSRVQNATSFDVLGSRLLVSNATHVAMLKDPAPRFSHLALTNLSKTELTASCVLNEPGTVFAVVRTNKSASVEPPSIADMLSSKYVVRLEAAGSTGTVKFDELEPATQYAVYFVATQLDAPNNVGSLRVLHGETVDTDPPAFVAAPHLWRVTATEVEFYMQLNEPGRVYFVLAEHHAGDNDEEPSPSQVKAGMMPTGRQVEASGFVRVPNAYITVNITIVQLQAQFYYDAFFVAEDVHNNVQSVTFALRDVKLSPCHAGLDGSDCQFVVWGLESVLLNGRDDVFTLNSTEGGDVLTVSGYAYDASDLKITLELPAGAASFECAPVEPYYETPFAAVEDIASQKGVLPLQTWKCKVGRGYGQDVKVVLTLRSALQKATKRFVSSTFWEFPPPTLTPRTLRRQGEAVGLPLVANPEGGDLIVLSGANFFHSSTQDGITQVFFGPLDDPMKYICEPTFVTDTTAYCTAQRATGTTLYFTVVVGNQMVRGQDVYTVPYKPIATSYTGCPAFGCSTAGGMRVTFKGQNFTSPLEVTVGGASCKNVDVASDGQSATCELPEGVGDNNVVQFNHVTVGSQAAFRLAYGTPILSELSSENCTTDPHNSREMRDCPRAGNVRLTISGYNFGASGALAFVGGVQCRHAVHDARTPHTMLTCLLPPGVALDRNVLVVQSGGALSTDKNIFAHISYEQCPGGYINNKNGWTACEACEAGKFASVLAQSSCGECAPGQFSNSSGSESCSPCSPGQFQKSVGQLSCLACPPGKFSSGNSQIVCEDCPSGTFSARNSSTKCTPCPQGTKAGSRGLSVCTDCGIGTFTDATGQSVCEPCSPGRFANGTGQLKCEKCPAGRFQPGWHQTSCFACEIGTISQEASESCLACPPDQFNYKEASVECGRCPGHGVTCDRGILIAEAGFWPHFKTHRKTKRPTVDLYPCPPNLCARGRCTANRMPYDTNIMCGECVEGHTESPGGHECVACNSVNWPVVTVLFVASTGIVYVLHLLSQYTTAYPKIFFFFVQSAFIVLGATVDEVTSWLSLFNLSAHQTASGFCLAPLGPVESVTLDLFVPCFLFVQLGLLLFLEIVYRYFKGLRFSKRTFWPYYRSTIAIALFSFNSLMLNAAQAMLCVNVDVDGGKRVLFVRPEIDCDSEAYSRLSILIYLCGVDVVVVPCSIAVFLYYKRDKIASRERTFQAQCGILYEAYSLDRWWYQSIGILRRAVLIMLDVAMFSNPDYRQMAITFFLLLVLGIHTLLWPYNTPVANTLETTSLLLLVVLSIMLIPSSIESVGLPMWVKVISAIIVIVPTLAFVVRVVFQLLRKVRRGFHHLTDRVIRKNRTAAGSSEYGDDDDRAYVAATSSIDGEPVGWRDVFEDLDLAYDSQLSAADKPLLLEMAQNTVEPQDE